MEDGLKSKLFALVLFCTFATLVVTSIVGMGLNYGKGTETIGDGALTGSDFESSIEDVSEKTGNYRARFESGDPVDVDDASGVFSIITDAISLITTPFTLLGQVLTNILKVPAIVINVILGLLGVSLILGAWRVLKAGA